MDLADAFDRVESFCAVQLAEQGGFTLEAVARLQEAVGRRELTSETLQGAARRCRRARVAGWRLDANRVTISVVDRRRRNRLGPFGPPGATSTDYPPFPYDGREPRHQMGRHN